MGREIRMVPPNWSLNDHQIDNYGNHQPMFDERFEDAVNKWHEGNKQWNEKTHPDYNPKWEDYTEYEGECPFSNYF